MPDILLYLIKSVAASGLLFGFYSLFLKNKKLHQYNRFYLLFAVVFSLTLPLLHFEWNHVMKEHNVVKLLQVMSGKETEHEVIAKMTTGISMYHILLTGYILISTVLAVALLARVYWLYSIKKKSDLTKMPGYMLVHTKLRKAPFSFLNNLYWNDEIAIKSEMGKKIMAHELAHIKQGHTVDKLFMQLVLIVAWINPIYWLMQKELSLVHEFMADEAAIDGNDTETFATMLLQSHFDNIFPEIVQPFFYSPVKRRLMMLTQNKKTSFSLMRKVMVLPLIAGAVFLFSFSVKNVHKANKKTVMILDAGHGGQDNGAVASDGLLEKDMALKVANHIKTLAVEYNIQVVQTRAADNYITLANRANLANEHAGDVFVSIHINEKETPGYSVILGKKNTKYNESSVLASTVISGMSDMDIHPSLVEKSLWVLNYSNMPAILIECGDINNSKDMAMLNNDAELDKLCRNILDGVVSYENNK